MELASFKNELDPKALAPLLAKGDLCLVSSREDGTLAQVTAMGLANATPSAVWDAVTDYKGYPQWMPGVKKTRILKEDAAQVRVAYELDAPGVKVKYTMIHSHSCPDRIENRLADDKGSIKAGAWRWDFIPHESGKKTFVVYSLYTDLRASSWLIKKLLNSQPAMEHGINVGSGVITLRAVIKKTEKYNQT